VKFHTNIANRWLSFSIHKVIWTCLSGPFFRNIISVISNYTLNTIQQLQSIKVILVKWCTYMNKLHHLFCAMGPNEQLSQFTLYCDLYGVFVSSKTMKKTRTTATGQTSQGWHSHCPST